LTKAAGKALATLRHMAAVRQPAGVMFEAVTGSLAEIVPFESATLVLYDDDYQATDAFLTHELAPGIANRYFARWFNREEGRYLPTHATTAQGGAPDVFRASEYQPRLWETELYDEVFRALGFHHMASMTLRQGGRARGHIAMGRPGGRDFEARDLKALNEAAAFATLALAQTPETPGLAETAFLEEVETALVLTDLTGAVQQLSPNALRMLRWASLSDQNIGVIQQCLREPLGDEASYAWVKPILGELAARVVAGLDGRPGPPALLRRATRHGEFVLRAYAMHAGGGSGAPEVIAVELQRRTPLEARLFNSDLFRELTSQEQQVCRLVLKRLSQPEIAQAMGVSLHTVISHVRNLYRRTGASGRDSLQTVLLKPPEG